MGYAATVIPSSASAAARVRALLLSRTVSQPCAESCARAYRGIKEVAAMEGSQPGKMIDAQMVREHGADVEVLDRAIRDIELDALKQQQRLSLTSPMPRSRSPHWWRRRD